MIKAILILPFNVLITMPVLILCFSDWALITPQNLLPFMIMIGLFSLGLALMTWTIGLFAAVKKGSLAPWNPIDKLITTGPYAYVRNPMLLGAYVRNPMLLGVFLVLGGEALLFTSYPLAIYLILFIIINALYFPLSEEKGLEKRFGQEYISYKNNVPRFIPRLSPYKPKRRLNI